MKKIALLLLMFVAFQVSAQDFHFNPIFGKKWKSCALT